MAHFTVILSILFSTSAVLGTHASQNQAESEELCDSPSQGRVALQKGRGHKVEGVVEEVADVSTMKKEDSLTQSGLATASSQQLPFFLEILLDKLIGWVIEDVKWWEWLLGVVEWDGLDHEVQTKIIESGPADVEKVLGERVWSTLSDHAKQALTDVRTANMRQIFTQKQALTEGRHADLHPVLLHVSNQKGEKFLGWAMKLFFTIDKVVEMYARILDVLGDYWRKLPTFIQSPIVDRLCKDESLDDLMDRIKKLVKDEEAIEEIKKQVKKAFDEICNNS